MNQKRLTKSPDNHSPTHKLITPTSNPRPLESSTKFNPTGSIKPNTPAPRLASKYKAKVYGKTRGRPPEQPGTIAAQRSAAQHTGPPRVRAKPPRDERDCASLPRCIICEARAENGTGLLLLLLPRCVLFRGKGAS